MRASCGATTPMVGIRCSATRRSASSARQRSMTCSVRPEAQVPGELGGHAHVGELGGGDHGRTAAPDLLGLGAQVDALHRPRVAHPEQRRLGAPGRARGEADGEGPFVVAGTRGSPGRDAVPAGSRRAHAAGADDRHLDAQGQPVDQVGRRHHQPGLAAATIAARSLGGATGLTPAVAAPRRARATAATSQSPPEGSASATTSPGPTPRAGEVAGEPVARWSSSA